MHFHPTQDIFHVTIPVCALWLLTKNTRTIKYCLIWITHVEETQRNGGWGVECLCVCLATGHLCPWAYAAWSLNRSRVEFTSCKVLWLRKIVWLEGHLKKLSMTKTTAIYLQIRPMCKWMLLKISPLLKRAWKPSWKGFDHWLKHWPSFHNLKIAFRQNSQFFFRQIDPGLMTFFSQTAHYSEMSMLWASAWGWREAGWIWSC